MIENFCQTLLRHLDEEIGVRIEAVISGTPSRETDERKRGEIVGMRLAQDEIRTLLQRARKAENEE